MAMQKSWAGNGWSITFDGSIFQIDSRGEIKEIKPTPPSRLTIQRSWFRRYLVHNSTRVMRLTGISKQDAIRLSIAQEISEAIHWAARFKEIMQSATTKQRWIPQEVADELVQSQPGRQFISDLMKKSTSEVLTPEEKETRKICEIKVSNHIAEVNERIVQAEMQTNRKFFDHIELKPLTEEQVRAVITYDNRLQVIAAAGSGKTSLMIARAAYAVFRGFVAPERILMLAFNKDAATELQRRVEQRFTAVGLDPTGVHASTFHSFGLDVIGKATGAKPRPASWLNNGQDIGEVGKIVDHLRDTDIDFRYRWDLFRLIFANVPTSPDGGIQDNYDKSTRETGFATFDGKNVRSHGERIIADWLYLNGVEYEYERQYSVRTATSEHSQYRPDFYYPSADLWHEHWALDRAGNPPKTFNGYLESMTWKRNTHKINGTKLIESTWAEVVHGTGLSTLEQKLNQHGIKTDWNPDRTKTGKNVLDHKDLCRLIRTFMTHIKSSKLTKEAIEARLSTSHQNLAGTRTNLFLNLYWPIHNAWNQRLQAEEFVDFEDMLSVAADHLENGAYDAPYDLILADEFQDASQARARIIRGLIRKPEKYLIAVGDDWQSINRFAGADISVMTKFEDWFGRSSRLELATTFRCPQKICDAASSFVSKNPSQIKKSVRSAQTKSDLPIRLLRCETQAQGLDLYLKVISKALTEGTLKPGPTGRVTVDVLGRYTFDKEVMPKVLPENLDINFRTVHKSKGLEADFIIIPNASSRKYGFPSTIVDDPVLAVAMATADDFAHAEERRLFYVALTRAKIQVTILTEAGWESPFVIELSADPNVEQLYLEGTKTHQIKICEECKIGQEVMRQGPYGEFPSCSRFPACKGKRKAVRRPNKSNRRAPRRGRYG